ncbi:spermatogenesis-associated protein 6 isoform X1 [Python bivittatus]|uniref:Spermatogenesis-associated protein 6 isoform X1 n=1 Tax=Python bivittatus TaxID=176946 RepID=A0A9F3QTV3_PYTBI|nr:spermatogenesis-associated protein 6 isoform X1 [Python bivittatus]
MAPCKGFVCVLELHIRTVTCPGVALKSRDDVYISACIFGQHKKTSCVRAIFPLIFDEKLMFEKVYTDVVDPGDLVELFETDASVLELIQTVPPVGEILARYEENTRDFLFPAPKFIHQQQSSVREVLMKKAYGFTGIAPKLKFYTTCVISESLLSSAKAQKQDNLDGLFHSSTEGMRQIRSSKKNTASPERNRPCSATKSYEQPTIASLSRSPSPYTKRRMCELLQVRQRLAHLDLGPFDFRKETDKPPFVIRRVEQLTPSPDVHTWCCPKENKDEAAYDPSLLGSYRPKNTKVIGSHREKDFDSFHDSYNEHLITKMSGRQVHSNLLMHSAPPSLQKYSSTPVLNRSSLRERFHTGLNTSLNGDEIHKRVKNILRTHSARQRLTFDETWLSKEEFAKIRDSSRTGDCKKRGVSRTDSLISNVQSSSSIQPNVMVHLDNGEYWTSQVAEYKNKPHRAIFEDSLEKIYRNMYRKASSSLSKNK